MDFAFRPRNANSDWSTVSNASSSVNKAPNTVDNALRPEADPTSSTLSETIETTETTIEDLVTELQHHLSLFRPTDDRAAKFLKRSRNLTDQLAVKFVSCPICYRALEDPKTTPCGHTFCEACFWVWFQDGRSCPTCRSKIAFPLTEPSPLQVVQYFDREFTSIDRINGVRLIDLSRFTSSVPAAKIQTMAWLEGRGLRPRTGEGWYSGPYSVMRTLGGILLSRVDIKSKADALKHWSLLLAVMEELEETWNDLQRKTAVEEAGYRWLNRQLESILEAWLKSQQQRFSGTSAPQPDRG